MNKIITISRQFGSGGREVGKILSGILGIPFYDNEIIDRAAKESGFSTAAFANAEKKATNSLLYSIAMGMNAYGNQELGFAGLSLDDRVYLAQAEVIKKYAKEGSCIIVGRCADYVLKDFDNVINVFIYADMNFRVKRVMELEHLSEDKSLIYIQKMDKRRANYYNYHASEKWGRVDNYHLSVRSDYVGLENCAKCIKSYLDYGTGK